MLDGKVKAFNKFTIHAEDFKKNSSYKDINGALDALAEINIGALNNTVLNNITNSTLNDLYNAIYNNSYVNHKTIFEKYPNNYTIHNFILHNVFQKLSLQLASTDKEKKEANKIINMVLNDLLNREVNGKSVFNNMIDINQRLILWGIGDILSKNKDVHIKPELMLKLYEQGAIAIINKDENYKKPLINEIKKADNMDKLTAFMLENSINDKVIFDKINPGLLAAACRKVNFKNIDPKKLTLTYLVDKISKLDIKFKEVMIDTKAIDHILDKYEGAELAKTLSKALGQDSANGKLLHNYLLNNHKYTQDKKFKFLANSLTSNHEYKFLHELIYLPEKAANIGNRLSKSENIDQNKFLKYLDRHLIQNDGKKLINDKSLDNLISNYLDHSKLNNINKDILKQLNKKIKQHYPKLNHLSNRIDRYIKGSEAKISFEGHNSNKILKNAFPAKGTNEAQNLLYRFVNNKNIKPEMLHKELDSCRENKHIPVETILSNLNSITKETLKWESETLRPNNQLIKPESLKSITQKMSELLSYKDARNKSILEKVIGIIGLSKLYNYVMGSPEKTILDKFTIDKITGLENSGKLLQDTLELYSNFAKLINLQEEFEQRQVEQNTDIVLDLLNKLEKFAAIDESKTKKISKAINLLVAKEGAVDLPKVADKLASTYQGLTKIGEKIAAQKPKTKEQSKTRENMSSKLNNAIYSIEPSTKIIKNKISAAVGIEDVVEGKEKIEEAYQIVNTMDAKNAKGTPLESLIKDKNSIEKSHNKVLASELGEIESLKKIEEEIKNLKSNKKPNEQAIENLNIGLAEIKECYDAAKKLKESELNDQQKDSLKFIDDNKAFKHEMEKAARAINKDQGRSK